MYVLNDYSMAQLRYVKTFNQMFCISLVQNGTQMHAGTVLQQLHDQFHLFAFFGGEYIQIEHLT